jgi:hypothetical protein
MSQLVKAINALDTGERKAVTKGLSPLFISTFNARALFDEGDYKSDIYKVYAIEARLGSKCMVDDSLRNPDTLNYAIDRTKRQVIEAIFGEFRQDFRLIEKSIYDHDVEAAGRHLRDMETKMFGVG